LEIIFKKGADLSHNVGRRI